jgi:hypothetical protein
VKPRVAFGEVHFGGAGDGDFEVGIGISDELGRGEGGVFEAGEVEGGEVEADEVLAVVVAVFVGAGEALIIPGLVVGGPEEVQFDVEVGTAFVDAGAGVTEATEGVAGFDWIANFDGGGVEVGVEGVEGALTPVVFEDDVAAVVAVGGDFGDMDDTARADSEDVVEGFAFGVAIDGFDVEAFVKAGVADLSADAAGVADEAEFAAFPGGGGLAFEGAVDELVEVASGIAEDGVVSGGEAEFEGGLLGDERAREEE